MASINFRPIPTRRVFAPLRLCVDSSPTRIRRPIAVEPQVPPHPLAVRLFRTERVVPLAHRLTHLLYEPQKCRMDSVFGQSIPPGHSPTK